MGSVNMRARPARPPASSGELGERVGSKEVRKVRMRKSRDRTLWHGIGAAGVSGWSIAVPTLIGVLVGMSLDRRWPGDFSWSLALLLAGVTLGCFNAWYWVNRESRMIARDEAEEEVEQ
jgi:ATP synthase protein I